MKKLFVAMMAVFVFASCGDDDKARSSGSVLDAMISKSEAYKKEIQAALDSGDSEKYVKALEKYAKEIAPIKKAYLEKMERLANVCQEVSQLENSIQYSLDFSDDQNARVAKALERLSE